MWAWDVRDHLCCGLKNKTRKCGGKFVCKCHLLPQYRTMMDLNLLLELRAPKWIRKEKDQMMVNRPFFKTTFEGQLIDSVCTCLPIISPFQTKFIRPCKIHYLRVTTDREIQRKHSIIKINFEYHSKRWNSWSLAAYLMVTIGVFIILFWTRRWRRWMYRWRHMWRRFRLCRFGRLRALHRIIRFWSCSRL